tara:strand:- start:492 stop:674 length:183 start_codon:yes stop_codon:yes gene_type:complete
MVVAWETSGGCTTSRRRSNRRASRATQKADEADFASKLIQHFFLVLACVRSFYRPQDLNF